MFNKFLVSFLTSLMFITIIPLTGHFNGVEAAGYYSMGCNANEFEVSYIENDATFSKVSCHSTFSEAKKAMKANNDYVVRYSKSYSPSKIVAMNSGIAYSYPGRRNSSTMYLYQNPLKRDDSRYKVTYIENHYEMTYLDTLTEEVWDIKSNGKGYIQVVMNGFEGFCDLEYTDLVPTKIFDLGQGIWLGGLNTYEDEDPFYVKPVQNYYQIEDNGNYTDLVFHFFRAYPSKGDSPISYEYAVDNASNYPYMKSGKKYYSNDGINFYSDSLLRNFVGSSYNYYQFLPVRSKTDIPASTFDAFLNKTKPNVTSVLRNEGQTFIDLQNKYGVNALLIYSMACLESAYGTSGYATKRYNLFGWSAYDDSPDDASYFTSVYHCVKEQMGRNLRWFLDYTNKRYFGSCVGNKGAGFNVHYASDPYWGVKIAAIAYSIDKYNNSRNGKLTDFNKYAIGFVKNNYNDVLYNSNVSWNPNIYKTSSGNKVLYTGQYGSHYQKDLTVILLEDTGNRYKIQSTNNVVNNEIVTDDGVFKYNWDDSVGYIDKENVVVLNNTKIPVSVASVEHKHFISLRDVSFNDNKLLINGVAGISGLNMTDNAKVTQEIIFYDLTDLETNYVYKCDVTDSDGYDLYDGFDYTYSGFDLSIDLSDKSIPDGSYSVKIKTTYEHEVFESYLNTSLADYRNIINELEDTTYVVKMNETSFYRMQMDVISSPDELSFSSINKPSKRQSMAALDTYDISDEGLITIEGHGFIYYSDFDNKEDVEFNVYLVDSKDNYLKLNTKLVESDIDYQEELGTSFNLDHISFVASSDDINTFELDGEYIVYLSIRNKDDFDITEMINYGFDDISVNNGLRNISFMTSNVRHRLYLKANEIH